MKFFKTVIRCCIAWLKKAPSLLQSQQDQRKDSDIYIVDEDLALLNSGSELMGLLQRFFCGCPRSLRYYLYFDRNPEKFEKTIVKQFKADFTTYTLNEDVDMDVEQNRDRIYNKAEDLVFGSALTLLDYFHDQGGFSALIEFLK